MTTRISVDLPADLLEAANLNQYRNRNRLASREDENRFKHDAMKQVKLLPATDKKDLYKGAVDNLSRPYIPYPVYRDRIAWMIVWHNQKGSFIEDYNVQPGGSIKGSSSVSMATSVIINTKAREDDRYFRDVEQLSFLLLQKEPDASQWNNTDAAYNCAYLGDIPPLGPRPIFFPGTDLFNQYFDLSYYTEPQVRDLDFYGMEYLSEDNPIGEDLARIEAYSILTNRVQINFWAELYERKEVDYNGVGTVPDCLGGSPYSVYLYGIKHFIKTNFGSIFLSLRKVTSKKYLYLSWRGVSPDDFVMDVRNYSVNRSRIPLNIITEENPGFASVQLVERITHSGGGYDEAQPGLMEWIRGNIVEIYIIEPSRDEENELITPSLIEIIVSPNKPLSLKNNFAYAPNNPSNGINSTIDMPFLKNKIDGQLRILVSGRKHAAN